MNFYVPSKVSSRLVHRSETRWRTFLFVSVYFVSLCQHEQASVKMFEHLVEVNKLYKEFEKWKLNEEDLIFITEQIAGPSENNVEVSHS